MARVMGIPLGQTAVHSNMVWQRHKPCSLATIWSLCFLVASRLSETRAKARFKAAGPRKPESSPATEQAE